MFKFKSIGAAALGLATATLGLGTVAPAVASGATASAAVTPQIVIVKNIHLAKIGAESIPSFSECRGAGLYCYRPGEIRTAYSLGRLYARKDYGRGQTIVIVDAYGSPTIRTDLKSFDKTFKLQNPRLVVKKFGTIRYRNTETVADWEGETSLDVEWAHAMAPKAKIELLETANSNKFFSIEQYAYRHHLGSILSQSWGSPTNEDLGSAAGRREVNEWNALYAAMGRHGWTVFASAGDTGTYGGSSHPTTLFPASSPSVTGVGGTTLIAKASGSYVRESVWNDSSSSSGASGGGVSPFAEPLYQKAHVKGTEAKVLSGKRGVPDVSWDGNPDTGFLVKCSASTRAQCQDLRRSGFRGWSLVGGTSAGSPQWAGYIADVNSGSKHKTGAVNTKLYRLGAKRVGFHDITRGSNGYDGVRGYKARRGYDVASGWGTPGARLSSRLITDNK